MEKKAKYDAAPRKKKAPIGEVVTDNFTSVAPSPSTYPPAPSLNGGGEGGWPTSTPEEVKGNGRKPCAPTEGRGAVWLWVREVVLEMVTDIDWAMEVRRAVLMMIKSNSTQGFRDGCMMLAKAIEKRYNVK